MQDNDNLFKAWEKMVMNSCYKFPLISTITMRVDENKCL